MTTSASMGQPNSSMAHLTSQIARGAEAMHISLTDQQLSKLSDYLALFIKWNKAYNLTAIRDPQQMVPLHLLDSLVVNNYVQEANNIADIGTGPGLPGIVLAIMNPDKAFMLLDSNGKKTRFLFMAKTALGLDNVTIVNDRVEAYHPPKPFDMIVSRAFASLYDMTHWCQHLRAEHGCFMAMKGQYPDDEIAAIEDDFKVVESFKLDVPGVDGERHLLRIVPA
ncbi:16S rRNA (guanine(527)-N(7))-methyltransferase RsmG [Bacterioplanoides sp.]|uniref:16S rRNA (guanine(527)-N(7))-methyltransferase RsmG n=1 Tax=Bacterioplanoides sp. TaxID=2066072 RepID=UPI003B00FD1E